MESGTDGRERMNKAEIQDKVSSVLAEHFDRDASELSAATRFREDLDADSLELMEVNLQLEEEFEISIPEEEMEDVKTVGEAVDLIAAKLGASA
jgi:acyl carrier protein